MSQYVKVIELAEKVRSAFEEIAESESGRSDLHGFCDRASVQLFLAAERHNIKGVHLCLGYGHVYCMFEHFIVDVTATQFGVKNKVLWVALFDLPKIIECTYPWQQQDRFHSMKELYERSTWWHNPTTRETDKSVVMKYTKEYCCEVECDLS